MTIKKFNFLLALMCLTSIILCSCQKQSVQTGSSDTSTSLESPQVVSSEALSETAKQSAAPDFNKAEFSLKIDDTFALKENKGCVVTGKVGKGSIAGTDTVWYADPNGKVLFECNLLGLENQDGSIDSAKEGDNIAIGIGSHLKSKFEVGGYIIK